MKSNAVDVAVRQPLYTKTGWRLGFNAVWVLIAAALVVALLAIGAVATNGVVLSGRNIQNLTWSWLAHALILPPIILIIASGGLDLSTGAVIGLCSVIVAQMASGGNLIGAALGGFFIALIIGVVNGLLAGGTRIPGALITLVMATLLRGLALTITEGKPILVTKMDWLAAPAWPWVLLVLSIAFGVVWSLLLFRQKAALKPGTDSLAWPVRLLYTGLPYVASSLMAGFVGLMYAARLQAGMATAGSGFEVDEILIALVGGVPLSSLLIANGVMNIVGGLLAALALAVLQNVSNLAALPVTLSQVITGVVALVTALVSYLYYLVVGLLPLGGQKRS
jgi:ribose transport system permease protein